MTSPVRTSLLRRSAERLPQLAGVALVVALVTGLTTTILALTDAALAGIEDSVAPQLARSVAAVALVILVLFGAVAVRELSRLIAVLRATETAVLASRGVSRRQLVVAGSIEAGLAAVPGAAVGVAVAIVVVGVATGRAPSSTTWIVAAAALAGAAVVAAAGTSGAIRGPGDRAVVSGRARRVVGVAAVVLLVAAATVAVWQSSISRAPDGVVGSLASRIIAAMAPALALLTATVAVLALVAVAARAADRATARFRGAAAALLVRQVARRVPVVATAVSLVSLAAGTVVFSGVYAATWERSSTVAHDLAAGAATRTEGTPVAGSDLVPALVDELVVEDRLVKLVALPAAAFADVLSPAAGVIEPDRLAAAARYGVPGVPVPAGAERLRIESTGTAGVALTLWLMDEHGALIRVIVNGDEAELPASDGVVIVAAELDVAEAESHEVSYRVTSLSTTDGVPIEIGAWRPVYEAVPDLADEAATPSTGIGVDVTRTSRDRTRLRLMPTGVGDAAVPIVVSTAVAERNGLTVRDAVSFRFEGSGRTLEGVIADVVTAVPGTGTAPGALVDLGALNIQQLTDFDTVPGTNQSWGGTGGVTPAGSDPMREALGVTRIAIAVGAAGAIALASVGVSAVALGLHRVRRREVRVLSALGADPRRLGASRAGELVFALGLALVGGAAAGIPVALLTAPGLARVAAPGIPPSVDVGAAIDGGGIAVGLAVLVAVVAIVALVAARRVVRLARMDRVV